MRDLMFAIAMLIAIPLAMMRPLIAFYMWGWTAVLIPASYFFGFMVNARINFVFALITLTLILLQRVPWNSYQGNRVTWLYLILLIHATLAWLFGYADNPINFQYYLILVKLMAFALCIPFFINNRLRMHMMMLVIVFGLGLHGLVEGLKTLASAGGHNMVGPLGSMIYDRNHLSTALALVLPLIYYLYFYAERRLIRWGFLGAFALVTLAILGGGSRGGFLALSIVGFWLIMTTRHKALSLFLVVLISTAFIAYAPERWTDRLSTIETASADGSFMGRVAAWQISSALALEHPIFGGGFHAVQFQPVWDTFKTSPGLLGFLDLPIPEHYAKSAHSIYFEVMGDMGFVGFFIFMAILLHSIHSRFSIKRMASQMGEDYIWARDMSDMLVLSIIAYMAGGAAVNLAYFEPIYMIIMLMEMLRIHLKKICSRGSIIA